jgi:dipeptidase E
MNLILTSNGITNNSIENVIKESINNVRKKNISNKNNIDNSSNIKIAFIPTAANIIKGDKFWVEEHYSQFQKLGETYNIDISKSTKKEWLPKLQESDVIVMGGGNAKYLMEQIIICGILLDLPELIKNKLYVGISAGSMITSKKVYSSSDILFKDKDFNIKAHDGLGYTDFNIRPHFNSEALLEDYSLKKAMSRVQTDMYALDDNSAIVYDTGKISIVSEGEWKLYKKNL